MTFRTETPFAPYVVPAENDAPSARLQLFLVASGSMLARVGDTEWKARSSSEVPIDAATRERLATAVGLESAELPASATVRRYVDDRSGNEAVHDLTFEPVHESRLLPYGLGGGTFGALVVLLLRRRGRARGRAQVSGA
ncbi:hypothetical protein EON77_11675 [bacterium]|nr:MAG: hypothetical protein EON77_11675 [bacterium]